MKNKYMARRFLSLLSGFLIFLSSCGNVTADQNIPNDENAIAAFAEQSFETSGIEEIQAAIYSNASYTIEKGRAEFVQDYEDDGKMLTDRKYSKCHYDSTISDGWVKIKGGSRDFEISVITDIGFEAVDVFNFYTRVSQCKGKDELFPKNVAFYVSTDGESYTFVGDGTTMTNTDSNQTTAIFSFVAEKGFYARYIKTVFSCYANSTLCMNEVASTAKGLCLDAVNGTKTSFRDSQGVIYSISDGQAEIIGYNTENTDFTGSVLPSVNSFNANGSVYYLGKGTDNEVKVTSDFIGLGQPNFSNAPNNIQYIIIHNTATTHESTTAERYNLRLHTTDDTTSWHYTVDENEIYHSLADSIVGWHAGPSHNYESIGIEICVNGAPSDSDGDPIFEGSTYDTWVENRFKKSLKNTAVLVAELLTRYGLGTEAVIQHYDVTQKECPLWMRHSNGRFVYNGDLWEYFMEYVEHYYYLFNGENPTQIINKTDEIYIPDYIETQDGEVYPVTGIAPNVFAEISEDISSITLGRLLNNIPRGCFDGNDDLEVSVPEDNKYFSTDKNKCIIDQKGNIIFNPNEASIVPSPKKGCALNIEEHNGSFFIVSLSSRYSLNEIEKEYGQKIIDFYDLNGEEIDRNAKLGTGTTIFFEDGARLQTVLKGDVDGDAKIGANDYLLTKRIFLGTTRGLERQRIAAAISNGKTVEANDYIMLKRHHFGLGKIF